MKLKKKSVLILCFLIIALTSFRERNDGLLKGSDINLAISKDDKQKIRTQGIQGQEVLIKVKTKEWERKQDSITEIWLTAWSTYEGKIVKSKLHRFLGDADKYHEPIIFRHFDKRNGVKEIKINLHIKVKN